LAFEEATYRLDSGRVPQRSTCVAVSHDINPGTAQSAINGIANVAIQVGVSQDLQDKLLLLGACIQGHANTKSAQTVGHSSEVVREEFAQLGVPIP
jgi:hypothetical protein